MSALFHHRRLAACGALLVWLAALAVLITACGSGDLPLAQVDPQTVPAVTTWDQVFPIIQRECVPCHDQGGAEPRLDRCEDVINNFDGWTQAIFNNSMPPGAWPRLTSVERLIVERYGGDAPCL